MRLRSMRGIRARLWRGLGLASLVALCAGVPAGATPITAPGALHSAATLIDFETFAGDPEPFTDSFATVTSNLGSGKVRTGFGDVPGVKEGLWFACDPIDACTYTILFDATVAQVGMGVVNHQLPNATLTAFDAAGGVLEQTVLPTVLPGGSSFHGFVRAQNEIKRVELAAPLFSFVGMDNLTYYVTPAPTSAALLASGLAALTWLGRPREK